MGYENSNTDASSSTQSSTHAGTKCLQSTRQFVRAPTRMISCQEHLSGGSSTPVLGESVSDRTSEQLTLPEPRSQPGSRPGESSPLSVFRTDTGPHACFPWGQRLINTRHSLGAFWRKGVSTQAGVCACVMSGLAVSLDTDTGIARTEALKTG